MPQNFQKNNLSTPEKLMSPFNKEPTFGTLSTNKSEISVSVANNFRYLQDLMMVEFLSKVTVYI
jgi:hypothetical protein